MFDAIAKALSNARGAGYRAVKPYADEADKALRYYLGPQGYDATRRAASLGEIMSPGADVQDALSASGETMGALMKGDAMGTAVAAAGMGAALGSVFMPGNANALRIGAARNPPVGARYRDPATNALQPDTIPMPVEGAFRQGEIGNDYEGRPLSGRFVVGRHGAEASERSLRADEAETVLHDITGLHSELVPRRQIRLGGDGSYRNSGGQVLIAQDLDAGDKANTLRHEMSHAIDARTFRGISTEGIKDELKYLYTVGASGAVPFNRHRTTPETQGYAERERDGEYVAEAIRLYVTNPAFIKRVAPKTAARIRAAVNDNPRLKDIIQFNSLGAIVGAGALATSGADDRGEM